MTSLQWAAINGHTDIVKILLAHGANVSTKDYDGKKDTTYIYMHIYIINIIKLQSIFFLYLYFIYISTKHIYSTYAYTLNLWLDRCCCLDYSILMYRDVIQL